jgi:anti-anti-sigma factor
MAILTQKKNDILIILIDYERATVTIADEFNSIVKHEIAFGGRNFIIDLSECEFIDSTFLSALVSSFKKIVEVGGDLKIFGLKPAVNSMFQLTRLSKVFDIYFDQKEALNSFK